ncbi:MAG: fimbria/pilus periplasmic chaperone [Agarilytica sp.]
MFKRSTSITLIFFSLFYSSSLLANITLDRVIIFFQPDKRPIQTVDVINIDDKRTFAVKTKVVEVLNPGTPEQTSQASKSLIVAPNAFEIAAQKNRSARLLLKDRNQSDIEKVYRVTFTPEAPSRPVKQESEAKAVKTKIDIIVGMGALILVPPKEVRYQLEASRDGKNLSFENKGNISTEIQPRKICKTEKECFQFNGARLYPGNKFEYELPEGFEKVGLTLSVRAAEKYSSVEFSPLK